MNHVHLPATNPTLFGRLRRAPDDIGAWNEFVGTYGPMIEAWCRKRGVSPHDAEDVTQDVLTRLARAMRSFAYDPAKSFRGWLKTVAANVLSDFMRERSQQPRAAGGDEGVWDVLSRVEARADFEKTLEDRYDMELFAEARDRVRLRVAERTWEAFRLTVLEAETVEEAARKSGLKVAMVYVARHKVQTMLREEIARLDRPGGSP